MKMSRIIWQSKRFPGMILTDRMLHVFREAYQNIRYFEPELRKAEAWLVTHEDRVPQKNWKAFVNTWMRNANRYAAERKASEYAEHPGSDRGIHHAEPKLLGDLFKEFAHGQDAQH